MTESSIATTPGGSNPVSLELFMDKSLYKELISSSDKEENTGVF